MTCLRLQYHGTCYSKLDSTLLRVEYVHVCVYGTKSSLSFVSSIVSLASCLDMATTSGFYRTNLLRVATSLHKHTKSKQHE